MTLLQVENLTKRFAGLTAVSDVTFEVRRGEILGLIGPNGAGKSTCFNMITGALKASAGRLIFDGTDITFLPTHRIGRLGVGRTFQHTSVFPSLTVAENIRAAGFLQASSSVFGALARSCAFLRDERRLSREVERIVDLVRLNDVETVLARALPYGALRRLGIGVALATRPLLLLMDEPAAGLNHTESVEFVEMTRTIRASGTTVLLVEHDMKVIMGLCDRLVVLDHGKKIAEGDVDSVRRHPDVIASYLGCEILAEDGPHA